MLNYFSLLLITTLHNHINRNTFVQSHLHDYILYNHIYTSTFFYVITQLQNYTISFIQKHYSVLRNHGILSVFHTVSYRIILSLAFVISFNMCVNSWCYWTITSVGGLIWLLLNYVTGRKHQFLSLLDHMYSHGN